MTEEIKEFASVDGSENLVEQAQPITFDPTKSYTWTGDTKFVLNGQEFGQILNSLRAIISTKEAKTILDAAEALNVVEGTLASAVVAGVVKEAQETPRGTI